MYICNRDTADHRQRNGLISRFLLSCDDVAGTPLSVTWVTVEPGSRQVLHQHPEIQVYVILQGGGLMTVGGETRQVHTGDLIYIPSNAKHGIENNTDSVLAYLSAATPAADLRKVYDQEHLTPDAH
ncbi:MAG: cupin domain-containing protein [Anaerolineae bacterium]|nr:cupin domain-containing protein [Anaerolineae bacterium]